MGFNLSFGKNARMRKLIGEYINARVREKRAFADLLKRLNAELDDNQIQDKAYERLRTNLEVQFYQKQEEEWSKIKHKFKS